MSTTKMKTIGDLAAKRVDRVIVENEMLRAGFAAFPYMVMRDKSLSAQARFTYSILLMYAWQEGSTFASQETLANVIRISIRQLYRYLQELRLAGYIDIERKDKRFNNTYIIKDVRSKLRKKTHA